MTEKGEYSSSTYIRIFDSWNEALKQANIGINKRGEVSESELLSELVRLEDELGSTPTVDDMREHGKFGSTTYEREFGSWNEAIEEAELDRNIQRNITTSELIEQLIQFADELGRTPTKPEMNKKGPYAATTYLRKFGSWNEALEQAGLQINIEKNISDDNLIEEIKRLADELDRTPSRRDMDQYGEFSSNSYLRSFSSWNQALREAGYKINKLEKIPRSKLLCEVNALADEIGSTPTQQQMKNHGRYGYTAYKNEFGNWISAIKEAGLEVNISSRHNISEERLKDEIQSLAEDLNRPPIEADIDEHGEFSGGAYYRAFGSWNDALIEAGYEPHKVLNPDHLDHKVDSVPELEIADMLLDLGVEYENEAIAITYDDGRTYRPDFVTENYVIEVKGQDWGEVYDGRVTDKHKAEVALNTLDKREYVVVGSKLPADIHIPWEEYEKICKLFQ